MSPQKLVLVDTDPGVDDAMAILYLQNSKNVKIHSITTVFGNSDVELTTRNALYLVKRFQLSVPVVSGAAAPLVRERVCSKLKVHGADGFGDSGVSLGTTVPTSPCTAAEHIVKSVRENPSKISILALGPATNLATALEIDPGIAGLVHEVILMGGAFGTSGRHGNITAHAEANVFYDPESMARVLTAKWPVVMVGLDVTEDCILTSKQLAMLRDNGNDSGAFIWDISRSYEQVYRLHANVDGCCIHDVAAAAYVVDSRSFRCEKVVVDVSVADCYVGKTTASPIDRSAACAATRVCLEVLADDVVNGFVDAIMVAD